VQAHLEEHRDTESLGEVLGMLHVTNEGGDESMADVGVDLEKGRRGEDRGIKGRRVLGDVRR
jgi:hypothetical protein